MFEERNYAIFNMSEVNTIDFNEVLETSVQTLRLSVDGTKSFVKWEGGSMPASISALTTKEGPYTHSQILSILSGTDWTSNETMNM